ncbi:hypothetical protein Tco_0473082 [Tanacetum coccineum]
MAEYSQKWHNGTSRTRSTETFNRLATIQAQLNNLGRETKKVNEKVYAAQVGCELCKGPHYTKDYKLKEEGKPLKKHIILNLVYLSNKEGNIEQQLQDSTKEILQTLHAAIRNQGASIKALEIQIGQMSKVLQERGSGSLPSSTETNPRDHVNSISTTVETDTTLIRHRIVKHPKGIVENVLVGIEPTVEEGEVVNKPMIDIVKTRCDFIGGLDDYPSDCNFDRRIHIDYMDPYLDEGMGDVIVGEPFCKASCVEAKRFQYGISWFWDTAYRLPDLAGKKLTMLVEYL